MSKYALIGILLLAAGHLCAARLPVRVYTTADGLPSNGINCILSDSRGFLWFGTSDGLSRFDGYQFLNFGIDQGLPGRVMDMLEAETGKYWIATDRGLVWFDPAASGRSRFVVYQPDPHAPKAIFVLAKDGQGAFWCGTAEGLYHIENAKRAFAEQPWKFHLVDLGLGPHGRPVFSLLPVSGGILWIGSDDGLFVRFPDGRISSSFAGQSNSKNNVAALLQDHQGRIWAGTWGGLRRVSLDTRSRQISVEKVYTETAGLEVSLRFNAYSNPAASCGWAQTTGSASTVRTMTAFILIPRLMA